MFAGGVEDARRTVEAHAIAHRQRRESEVGGSAGQFFGQRGPTQEAKGAAGVQFDVGGTGSGGSHWIDGFSRAGRRPSIHRADEPDAGLVRAG